MQSYRIITFRCCSLTGHCGFSAEHCDCEHPRCKKYYFYKRLFSSKSEFVTVDFPEGGLEIECSAALERRKQGFLNRIIFESDDKFIFTSFTCFGETFFVNDVYWINFHDIEHILTRLALTVFGYCNNNEWAIVQLEISIINYINILMYTEYKEIKMQMKFQSGTTKFSILI